MVRCMVRLVIKTGPLASVNDDMDDLDEYQGKAASMADPEWAAFNLFGRQELEEGIEFDREIKEKLMSQWQVGFCIS